MWHLSTRLDLLWVALAQQSVPAHLAQAMLVFRFPPPCSQPGCDHPARLVPTEPHKVEPGIPSSNPNTGKSLAPRK